LAGRKPAWEKAFNGDHRYLLYSLSTVGGGPFQHTGGTCTWDRCGLGL